MIAGTSEKLRVEQRDHTVVITIANPPANTWDEENLSALEALVNALERDDDIYSLVITGAGDRFFSAGADLNVFASGDRGVAARMAQRFGNAFETLAGFRGVSIAAINGFAMGGGLECALACDIRVAEEGAALALPEASVGLLPCGGGTQNLAWLVGEGWAKRMILCGEKVSAETAREIGLVEEVTHAGASLERALELASMVENQSPKAVSACKQLIQAARRGDIAAAYAAEREQFVALFDTEDQSEGVSAFLEKRKPAWKNR